MRVYFEQIKISKYELVCAKSKSFISSEHSITKAAYTNAIVFSLTSTADIKRYIS